LRDKKNQAEAKKSNNEEQEEQYNEAPPNTNIMKKNSQYKVKNELCI